MPDVSEAEGECKPITEFDYIYNADGTCGAHWACHKPGVVLAYDDFSPESATWFCDDCWQDFEDCPWLVIAQDKRTPHAESEVGV